MKSRELRKLLKDTTYTVHFEENKVCIGSPYVSHLLTVDTKTLSVKYALDTFRKGRDSLGSKNLTFIWDKLHELIQTGDLQRIITENDSTVGMFPVYSVREGCLIESFTDEFGWPHSTHDGTLMYNNTFFKTKSEAIKDGIKEECSNIKRINEHIEQLRLDLIKKDENLKKHIGFLQNLNLLNDHGA